MNQDSHQNDSIQIRSQILDAIPNIQYGFGTRQAPIPAHLKEAWEKRKPQWKQVHGIACCEITTAHQEANDADALWTQVPGQWVGVVTADCVPILLAHKDGRACAAIHAGWRGTFSKIVRSLAQNMPQLAQQPQEWVACIGPAIGPCCYEVSPELAQDFLTQFSNQMPPEEICPSPHKLDLPKINEALLQRIGVKKIEILRHCTRCTTHPHSKEPLFESFRRDANKNRQWSLIGIRETLSNTD
jgi:YfiH family protein